MMLGSVPFERADRIKLIDEFVSLYPVILRNLYGDQYVFEDNKSYFYCCTHNMIATVKHNTGHYDRSDCKANTLPTMLLPRAYKKNSTANGVTFSNIQRHVDHIRESKGFSAGDANENSIQSRNKDDTGAFMTFINSVPSICIDYLGDFEDRLPQVIGLID